MERDDHKSILNAYVSRLTLADISMINEAKRTLATVAMTANTHSQIDAQKWLGMVVSYIVEHMTEHDLRLIDETIAQCTGKDSDRV